MCIQGAQYKQACLTLCIVASQPAQVTRVHHAVKRAFVCRLSALRASAPACSFGTALRNIQECTATCSNVLDLHPKQTYEIDYAQPGYLRKVIDCFVVFDWKRLHKLQCDGIADVHLDGCGIDGWICRNGVEYVRCAKQTHVQEVEAAEKRMHDAELMRDLAAEALPSADPAGGNCISKHVIGGEGSSASLVARERELEQAQRAHAKLLAQQARGPPAAAPFQSRAERFDNAGTGAQAHDGDVLDLEPWLPDSLAVAHRATRPSAPNFAAECALGRAPGHAGIADQPPLMDWVGNGVFATARRVKLDDDSGSSVWHTGQRPVGELTSSTGPAAAAGFGARTADRCASHTQSACFRARGFVRVLEICH